jgi:hypothetical protein
MEFPMDLNDFDIRLQKSIRTLLLKNEFEEGSPAFGVAHQVVRQGFRSLSWKQRFIYLEQMEPLLRRHGLSVGREWERQRHSASGDDVEGNRQ